MANPVNRRRWRFYGRETEIAWLRTRLQLNEDAAEHTFGAFGIAGRRGVGKSEVMTETMLRHGQKQPYLAVALSGDNRATAQGFMHDLLDALDTTGHASWIADLPPQRRHCTDDRRFVEIIQHLLDKDVIIWLDEFHNSRHTGVPWAIKSMIDQIKSNRMRTKPIPKGKLVCMGSHQQEFRALFDETAPLHLRMRIELTIHPWTPATVMTMARDQGWDRHPARLHTLWTAYDGMPYLWERLATDPTIPEIVRNWATWDGKPDRKIEAAWREAFLEQERRLVTEDERLSWDHRAIIELPDPMRETFLCMGHARNAGRMVPTPVIARTLNREMRESGAQAQTLSVPALERRLHKLERETGLIEHRGFFTGLHTDDTGAVWTISDNMTLFQIRALSHGVKTPDSPGAWNDGLRQARKRMEGLEGELMERLGALWLREHPQSRWSYGSVLPPRPKTGAARDIDILARIGSGGPNDLLVLGNAKREPEEHDPEDFVTIIEAFMARADEDADIKAICNLPRCLIAISPAFTETATARLETAGMLCFDLATMRTELETGWPRLNKRMHSQKQTISRRSSPPLP